MCEQCIIGVYPAPSPGTIEGVGLALGEGSTAAEPPLPTRGEPTNAACQARNTR